MSAEARRPAWIPTLLVLALVIGFVALRSRPPAPAPIDAPATTFSAARARVVLERIAGDQAPHGVGTAANAAVRERIAAELEALGLVVERQAAIACRGVVCAPVVNLVAEVPGAHTGGPAVLLVSHYDSVHAGPGVADDLHGVAVGIETARALLAGERPEHPVRLLVDEGEEVGLLGATAFVEQHPRASEIAVVVNAEARGTSGLSAMFETSDGNAALVGSYLGAASRPSATSLAYEVYRRMPNDTDLSVFKRAGYAGLNFAFVGDVAHYHTPLDDLAHLDMGSVQHQGDNVLATVRALASGPLPLPATGNAIYADVLGLVVVRWPEAWAVPVAVGLCTVLVVLAIVARGRGRLGLGGMALGLVAAIGTVVLTVATAFVVALAVSTVKGTPVPAHAWPQPLRLVLWLVAIATARALAVGLHRWARPLELALGTWIAWGLAAVALAVGVPGASVALCIPLGVAGVGMAWAVLGGPRHELRGILLAAVGLVALLATLALALEDVFGWALVPAVAAPIAVAVSGVLPGLVPSGDASEPRLRWILALAIAGGTLAAWLVPTYDDARPRRIALQAYDDRATGRAIVAALAVDGLPAEVRRAGGLAAEPVEALPWTPAKAYVGPATPGAEPPPRLDVVDGGAPGEPRRARARLSSPRGADRAVVLVPPERLRGAWVEGQPVGTASDPRGRLLVFGLPPHGVVIDLEIFGADPIEATVVDCVGTLPESARPLAAARDAAGAVTMQWGDVGCIATRAML
jgi:uncharacterized protein (DUF697 family)